MTNPDHVPAAELRRIVLETVASTPGNDWRTIRIAVLERVKRDNLGPVGRHAAQLVNQTIIGLILDGFVTLGARDGNYEPNWPSIMLTDLGQELLSVQGVYRYDPDGYLALTVSEAPGISERSKEYLLEGARCFQHSLLFASAVMIGAAAEVELLRLAEAIARWESDPAIKEKLTDSLERMRLPSLFEYIRAAVDRAVKDEDMPYETHQGSPVHLLSFHEMVRVLRNSAVHSNARDPQKAKVLLCLNTFPTAVATLDRLREWFELKAAKATPK
jgi:hypothetical protein